jgi:hypothetical protein
VLSSARTKPADEPGSPPLAVPDDPPRKAHLAIERSKEFLDRHEPALDLDHQGGAIGRSGREQVDRTALAIDREAHLRGNGPPAPPQVGGGQGDEQRMVLVEEPVKLAGTPPWREQPASSAAT